MRGVAAADACQHDPGSKTESRDAGSTEATATNTKYTRADASATGNDYAAAARGVAGCEAVGANWEDRQVSAAKSDAAHWSKVSVEGVTTQQAKAVCRAGEIVIAEAINGAATASATARTADEAVGRGGRGAATASARIDGGEESSGTGRQARPAPAPQTDAECRRR